jgi:hypothetical protein
MDASSQRPQVHTEETPGVKKQPTQWPKSWERGKLSRGRDGKGWTCETHVSKSKMPRPNTGCSRGAHSQGWARETLGQLDCPLQQMTG